MKIITVFTQPIENNTSSMIRCRNVINGMASIGNDIIVYSPYPDKSSIYYGETFYIHKSVILRRYGKSKGRQNDADQNNNVSFEQPRKKFLIDIALKIYRKFDLFGAAIINVNYTDDIIKQIENEKFEVILSFSGPIATHIISNKIYTRKKGMRYIQQWGDPLAADITRRSLTPIWIQKRIERKLLTKPDKVFYVSPLTLKEQKYQYKKYSEKMEFVPTPAAKRIYEKTNNKRLSVGYFGSYHSSARNIIPLYEAAKTCTDIEFIFVGDSDIKLDEKDNVQIVERVTPDEIDRLMGEVDVVVCLMNIRGAQIPGKMYNYACTNKEILMITDGDNADEIQAFFQQYKRFVFARNKTEEIIQVLHDYEENGVKKREPVQEFLPETIAERMLSL